MENRFGFKDLILTTLMLVMLFSFWMTRIQYNRQWAVIQRISDNQQDIAGQLRRLSDTLESGDFGMMPTDGERRAGRIDFSQVPPFQHMLHAQQQPDYAVGDWMVRSLAVTVRKLTPLVSTDLYQRWIENYVLESLVGRDPDTFEWQPLIAESWQISDDGLTFTFDIRRGVRFSDGEPLTAQDVVFTYEWIMNPRVNAPRLRAYYDRYSRVYAEGDYRVVFEMEEPYFLGFSFCAAMPILAKHFYGEFTEEQFNEAPGLLFGSGPYRLQGDPREWEPGRGQINLVRNENYWGPRPALNRIVFREISEPTVRRTAFINRELDTFAPTPDQYLTMRDDENVLGHANMHIFEAVDSGYIYVGWNQLRNNEPTFFADRRVRQAMALLINREEICDRIMLGLATPATGPFHPLGTQADPDLEPWPFDPQRGMALLREAGFRDISGDGVLQAPDGRPFRFRLIYSTSSTTAEQMVLYMRDALMRAGIELVADPLEWTIMQQRIDDRDFDAMTLGWGGSIESDPYQMFHSSQIEQGGDNYIHYVSEELDALIDEARRTVDDDARMALWRDVSRVLHEDQPYMFLFNRRDVVFIDKRFRNVRITPIGPNMSHEWYVPQALQRRGR